MLLMLKSKYKIIFSWVNSQIIDYPANVRFFCFTTFFLMILVSPIITIFLLFLITLFFSYRGLYKNIFITWGFYFFSWYFVFTALFIGFEGKILICPEHTGDLFAYALFKYSKSIVLDSFCTESLILLHTLNVKRGFPIYIPSIFKGVLLVVKFLFGGGKGGTPSECAPEKSSGVPSPGTSPSEINPDKFFSSAPSSSSTSTSTNYTDYLDQCKDVRDSLRKNRRWYSFIDKKSEKFNGSQHDVMAFEARIPVINYIISEGCFKGKKTLKSNIIFNSESCVVEQLG